MHDVADVWGGEVRAARQPPHQLVGVGVHRHALEDLDLAADRQVPAERLELARSSRQVGAARARRLEADEQHGVARSPAIAASGAPHGRRTPCPRRTR